MARYEIIKPWSFTVSAGDVIEVDKLHPSLIPHVRKLPDESPRLFEVASPQRGRPPKDR